VLQLWKPSERMQGDDSSTWLQPDAATGDNLDMSDTVWLTLNWSPPTVVNPKERRDVILNYLTKVGKISCTYLFNDMIECIL
jgi:hypothetical protein